MVTPAARTITGALVEKLRADIIDGHLAPGSRLKLNGLADRYGAGLIPLREALSRLANQGLLTAEEQKGFRVTPISREDLLDITQTRIDIECLALRRSIQHGDIEWESRVIAAAHRISRLQVGEGKNERVLSKTWDAAHREYHAALVSGYHSEWSARFRMLLADQTRRYRQLSVAFDHKRDVASEHAAITEAVLKRDADLACALMAAHFWKTTDIVLQAAAWAGR